MLYIIYVSESPSSQRVRPVHILKTAADLLTSNNNNAIIWQNWVALILSGWLYFSGSTKANPGVSPAGSNEQRPISHKLVVPCWPVACWLVARCTGAPVAWQSWTWSSLLLPASLQLHDQQHSPLSHSASKQIMFYYYQSIKSLQTCAQPLQ